MTLTVLWSTGPLKPDDNPYLHQLQESVASDVTVLPLTARTALWARPDVFHVHWPHQLYRAANPLKSLVKTALSTVLLLRLRARRVPVVLTMHNRTSHEREGLLERPVLRLLERSIATRIHLNESAENDDTTGVTILHGDYRAWLRRHGAAIDTGTPERDVLLFGMLRPYKGIEALMDAADAAGASLTVMGRALDPAYGEHLQKHASTRPGTVIDMRHRSDPTLVAEIRRHRLVCLPYRDMYNSGALLYALSVGRPVLVPRSPANAAIAAEVGAGWVHQYDGDLTADDLRAALSSAPGTAEPDLRRRGWAETASLHVAAYRALAAGTTQGPTARDAILRDPAFAAHSSRNVATQTL